MGLRNREQRRKSRPRRSRRKGGTPNTPRDSVIVRSGGRSSRRQTSRRNERYWCCESGVGLFLVNRAPNILIIQLRIRTREKSMGIVLDHTIVPARDKELSARFLARI